MQSLKDFFRAGSSRRSEKPKKHDDNPDKADDDAPPEYSKIYGDDRMFEKLREYDTIFLVDDSSSMSCDMPSGNTRWEEAHVALEELAAIASKYDSDGIDISFLNSKKSGKGLKSPAVAALFPSHPSGCTDIGASLQRLFDHEYVAKMEAASREEAPWPKRRNYIIITDGDATDTDVLKKFLRRTAQTLSDLKAPQSQIGFQFLQIGDDPQATRFLEELDGDNQDLATDIVDTYKTEGSQSFDVSVLKKVLLGGINRHVDRKS